MSRKMSGSLNLEQLVHVKRKMKGKEGEIDVLVIPVKSNGLHVGEKSTNMNFDLVIHDQPDQYDNDGFLAKKTPVKNMFPNKKWADLTKEEQDKINELSPIMGNFRDYGSNQNTGYAEAGSIDDEEEDNLPF